MTKLDDPAVNALNLSPDDTLDEVITRYPLATEYVIRKDNGNTDWSQPLNNFLHQHEMTFSEFESDLRRHLQNATRPETENCETITCSSLPFCPDSIVEVSGDFSRRFLGSLQQFIEYLPGSKRICSLVRLSQPEGTNPNDN